MSKSSGVKSQANSSAAPYVLELDSYPPRLIHNGVAITIDFNDAKFRHRLKTSGKNQPLTKALGVARGVHDIADLSAGLGGDAATLAYLGCRVRAVERNETLFQLLSASLKHVSFAGQITLLHAEAKDFLATLSKDLPEAIYFDPMYSVDNRKALPRKEMQLLTDLIGPDTDQQEVLYAALSLNVPRVVVKRPKRAPLLLEGVSQSFEGSTTRYDLYLKKSSSVRL